MLMGCLMNMLKYLSPSLLRRTVRVIKTRSAYEPLSLTLSVNVQSRVNIVKVNVGLARAGKLFARIYSVQYIA